MKFKIKNINLKKFSSPCVVLGISEINKFSKLLNIFNKSTKKYISDFILKKDTIISFGKLTLLYNTLNITPNLILLVGCGKNQELSKKEFIKITSKVINFLYENQLQSSCWFLIELPVKKLNIYWKIRIITEIIGDKLYSFDIFKTKKSNIFKIKKINFCIVNECNLKESEIALKHSLSILKGKNISRDLSNTPPNICTPFYLSEKSKLLSEKYKETVTTEIFDANKIKEFGMNAYFSVGKGSNNSSYMSIINYKKNFKLNKKLIVLIGKGVTFDSGGISIKPSKNMDEMKYDMSGAAAVYGVMLFAAELNLPLNIMGIIAGSENMPDGNSFRPGDVLKTLSGKTVEILDTDAEGRLILCDVLTYVEQFDPDIVIDIATLTGACVIALGNIVSGVMSNDKNLVNDLIKAGKLTEDKIWELPLHSEYKKLLSSDIADFSNIGGPKAGAISAAMFLSFFTKKYKWAHLDVAGTAWNTKKKKESTGRPVPLLCQFLLNKSGYSY
ncbi:leucyl aminopeptidase [Buchnera aphidicola]|uniref:leucyl aminopeptidase n=1 Tax=Buchnera aphidicola TaxID=9 RepID=UPI0031B69F87